MTCLFLSILISVIASDGITLGDERKDAYLPLLENKSVALFSNHSGIVGDRAKGLAVIPGSTPSEESCLIPFGTPALGEKVEYGPHIADALIEEGVKLQFIFSPEHGFRGDADAGQGINSGIDEKTGLPVYSMYGKRNWSLSEKITQIDAVVVDIQDVGLRYYTYYITMLEIMDECAVQGKEVIILDRPNPNGFYVGGTVLDMAFKSGVGAIPIATVHGCTIGELAYMANEKRWLKNGKKCSLTIIPCLGYTHNTLYSLLKSPSPNLKDMKAVYLYASTCYFEGTCISLGRGTAYPFEIYGHPLLKGDFQFTPLSMSGAANPPLKGEKCYGKSLRDKPLKIILQEGINLSYVIDAYRDFPKKDSFFLWNGNFFDKLMGTSYVREMITHGDDAEKITSCAKWQEDLKKYILTREKYLLYD